MELRPSARWLLLATVAALWIPTAAAHEGCPEHADFVDQYLLKDSDGKLRMSYLAPSAANASTWSVQVRNGQPVTLDLAFPRPAYVVNEDVDLSGRLKFSVEYPKPGVVPYVPGFYSSPHVHVELVEGARAVTLGDAYYPSGEFKLQASYPGHGKDGAAHTHGAGDDAARGLYSSDLIVRFTFSVYESMPDLQPRAWTVNVHIDGKSFLRAARAGEAPVDDAEPQPTPEDPEETAPEPVPDDSNSTGNSTESPESAPAGPSEDPRTQSAWANPLSPTSGLVAAGLCAGAGVALVGWRRARTR